MKLLLALLASVALALPAALQAADVSITAANVVPSASAKIKRGTAGAALTAGQLVYLESSTNTLKLADANSATAEARVVAGIVINSAPTGGPVHYVWRDPALVLGGTTAKGTIYVLSATAGGVAPAADLTAGWYPHVLAVGVSATVVAFDAGGVRGSAALE
jgi:hypothetical protein